MCASLGGGGLVELAFAFSGKTDAVKLAVKIGAPSVGFARPYSHIGHLPVRSVERFDLDRAVRQFRSALAIRSFYEFPRDTQLGPGHPEKQRYHRGFHGRSPHSEGENLVGGNDRSMARLRLPPSDTPPRLQDRPLVRFGAGGWRGTDRPENESFESGWCVGGRSTEPANDPGSHHRPVKGGVALADNFLVDRVMIGADSQQ